MREGTPTHLGACALALLPPWLAVVHGGVEPWAGGALGVVAATWLTVATWRATSREALSLRWTGTDALLLGLLVLAGAMVPFSVYPYLSRVEVARMGCYLVCFWLTASLVRSRRAVMPLAWVVVASGAALAVLALVLGAGTLLGQEVFSPFLSQEPAYGVRLTFVNHTDLAGYLLLTLGLCLGLAMGATGGARVVAVTLAVCLALAVLLTLSRGGAVALAGGLAFVFLASGHLRARRTVGSLLGVLVLLVTGALWVVGPGPVLTRLGTLRDAQADPTRLQLWKDATVALAQRPLLGSGPGTYAVVSPRFQSESWPALLIDHPHNQYLEKAVELGVVGLALALAAVAALFRSCLVGLGRHGSWPERALGLGALSGCVSLLIQELFDFQLAIPSNALLFAMCAALAVGCAGSRPEEARHTVPLGKRRRRMLRGAAVLLAGAVGITALTPWLLEVSLAGARKARASGHALRAARLVRVVRLVAPDNPWVWSAWAEEALHAVPTAPIGQRRELLEEAASRFARACELCPLGSVFHEQLAGTLVRLGRDAEALRELQAAVEAAPTRAYLHGGLGRHLVHMGRSEEALASFRRSLLLSSDPSSFEGALETARRTLDVEADLIVPYTARHREWVAAYLQRSGHPEAVPHQLLHALVAEPTVPRARAYLARLVHARRFDDAIRAHAVWTRRLGTHRDLDLLAARALEGAGRVGESEGMLRTAIAREPLAADVHLALAGLLVRTGRPADAASGLERTLARLPHEPALRLELAAAQRAAGQSEAALATLRQVTATFPGKPDVHVRAARLFEALHRPSESLAELRRAVTLQPDNPGIRHELANAYARLGVWTEAEAQWREALRLDPSHAASRAALEKAAGRSLDTRDGRP